MQYAVHPLSTQIHAEQPTTSYSEFKRELLSEIGRCLQVPVNILLGDSSKHNYASGRLDHQTFFKSIKVEQTHCEQIVLNKIFCNISVEFLKA
ncbi:MAG: phage portal protein, partial [Planctomycetaceae bacterium]|nr:phage portal protein [Planctomycetaceae bacterium]